MSSRSFKNIVYKLGVYKSSIFNMLMYKQDLALNNLQELICQNIQPIHQQISLTRFGTRT